MTWKSQRFRIKANKRNSENETGGSMPLMEMSDFQISNVFTDTHDLHGWVRIINFVIPHIIVPLPQIPLIVKLRNCSTQN